MWILEFITVPSVDYEIIYTWGHERCSIIEWRVFKGSNRSHEGKNVQIDHFEAALKWLVRGKVGYVKNFSLVFSFL